MQSVNRERKQQDTHKILLDTRLSEYFQEQVRIRRLKLSPKKVNPDAMLKKYLDIESNESAAIQYLLNYYEFLSVGILSGNLDEGTLRDSIRQILCGLVFDMREVIHHLRVDEGRPRAYENLVKVYFNWVAKVEGNGEWEKNINLGPNPNGEK